MKKPNVVFVHVDQMHHKAVSAYGNRHVKTPCVDRLVAEGHSFMESTTPMPQCCPARASWFTGRMSKEHGVVVNGCPIDPTLPDLGQWLTRRGGYDAVHTGKWHVSGRNVADSFRVLHAGCGMGELGDSDVARSATAYLLGRKSDKPFFLSVGLLNPHDCCYAAGANGGVGKFGLGRKLEDLLPPLPANFNSRPARAKSHAGRVGHWTELHWRYYIYVYYRMVEMVDREVGRIYDALRGSRHADNTLFVFTADHGDGLGFHRKISKGFLEEEAWRVPAVVCWPGRIKPGVRDTNHLVSGIDIPATVCDYAGVDPLPKMTVGRSWRGILEGKSPAWRPYVVGETSIGPLSTAIRDARYKSIFYENTNVLYDIAADPLETKNLAGEGKCEAVVRRHRQHFREYLGRIEVYPEPPNWAQRRPKRAGRPLHPADLYKRYVAWYKKVQAEG